MCFSMARLVFIVFGAILFYSFGVESISGGKSKTTSSASSSASASAGGSTSASASSSTPTKPLKCADNEILDKCPVECPSDYCPKSRDDDQSKCPKPKKCPPAACKCGFNLRRADNKTCIPTKSCPPFKCKAANEVYNPCPSSCPGEDCSEATADGKCHLPGRLPVVECKPACRCKKNYWRLNGDCVTYSECQYDAAKEQFKRTNVGVTGKYLYKRLSKYPNQSYSIFSLQLLCTIGHLVEFADDDVSEKIMEFLDMESKDQLKQVVSDAVTKIQSDDLNRLSLKVLGDCNEEFTEAYEQSFQDINNGESELVAYSCPKKALRSINDWFHEKSSYNVENITTTEMFDDPMGVVYITSLDSVYSMDHEANPGTIKDIDFRVSPGKTLKFPSLYGIGYYKYAELEDMDARLIIFNVKGGGYACLFCPNDPNDLVELVRKNQDPEVFYGNIERAQWMCIDGHVTIGYADVTNEILEFIPELGLQETDFKNVFKSGKSAHVNGIYQQLHLHYDPKTREGPLNSELCPEDGLPFVKIDQPFAYYVVDSEWSIVYAGALIGPQSYGLETSNPP